MARIALGIEYDGSTFSGWQAKAHARGVQSVVEAALSRVADHPVEVVAAGRTDAGVHAAMQVVHFDTMMEVIKGEYPRPRELAPEVPAALQEVILRAMALESKKRYQNAAGFRPDLDGSGFDDESSSVRFGSDCDAYYAATMDVGWDLDDDGAYEAAGAVVPFSSALLDVYLGRKAGRRVLAGDIVRGSGEAIRAVIWCSDLRGFTRLTDRLPGRRVTELLNRVYESQVAAIHDGGGEVLKFPGDGLVAIFPIENAELAVDP